MERPEMPERAMVDAPCAPPRPVPARARRRACSVLRTPCSGLGGADVLCLWPVACKWATGCTRPHTPRAGDSRGKSQSVTFTE